MRHRMKALFPGAANVLALCCIVLAQLSAATAAESSDRAIDEYMRQLAQPLEVDVQHTLDRIDGTGRQLLALRSYLRAQDSLAARWSWSEAEIAAYERSPQYQDMMREVGKVTAQFEKLNPGFTLYANSKVRSLDEQIEKWNSNAAVGEIAGRLLSSAREQLALSTKSSASVQRAGLREFLFAWQPRTPTPLAAPGLSLHGRGRALDFQIQQGNRIVAGAEIASVKSVWMAQGWAQRLAVAMRSANTKFQGPLAVPNEPWHFEYRP